MTRQLDALIATFFGKVVFFVLMLMSGLLSLATLPTALDVQPAGWRALLSTITIMISLACFSYAAPALSMLLVHGLRKQFDEDVAERETILRTGNALQQTVREFEAATRASCETAENLDDIEVIHQRVNAQSAVLNVAIRAHATRIERMERRNKWRGRMLTTAEILAGSTIRRYLSRARHSQQPGQALTSVAARLAGPRHAHLRAAWQADLAGSPEHGITVTPRQARQLGIGFVLAGLRLRLHTLGAPLWVPVDWILKSKTRTTNTIATAVGAVAIYFQLTDGLHGLLADGIETGVVVYGLLHVAASTLRRHRAIELSDPPETTDRADQ
ncbi:hypothetical protein ACFVFS_37805 [Kitasatospora sp. NPDC057692]|uniref:hypothetical protein n=1 Tax=Kitasatospora sp. NPDC057692 TaxID=3346215 RepID=UPI0036B610A8